MNYTSSMSCMEQKAGLSHTHTLWAGPREQRAPQFLLYPIVNEVIPGPKGGHLSYRSKSLPESTEPPEEKGGGSLQQ